MVHSNNKQLVAVFLLLLIYFCVSLAVCISDPVIHEMEAGFENLTRYPESSADAFPEQMLFPLFPLLLKTLSHFPLDDIAAYRFASLGFLVAALGLLFILLRNGFGAFKAFFIMLILFVDPTFFILTGRASPYTLILFLVLLMAVLQPRINTFRNYVAYLGAGLALVITTPIGLIVALSFGFASFFLSDGDIRKKNITALAFWTFLPICLLVYTIFQIGADTLARSLFTKDFDFPFFTRSALSLLAGFFGFDETSINGSFVNSIEMMVLSFLKILLLAAGIVSILRKSKTSEKKRGAIWLICLITVLLISLAGGAFQVEQPALAVLMAFVPLAVLMILGADAFSRSFWVVPVMLLVVCSLWTLSTYLMGNRTDNWDRIVRYVREYGPSDGDIVISPLEKMNAIAANWPEKQNLPIIRRNGFFNNGAYTNEDEYVAFHWKGIPQSIERDQSALDKNITQLRGKGLFLACISNPSANNGDILFQMLRKKFRAVDHLNAPAAGMRVLQYFKGDKNLLEPLLTSGQIDKLLVTKNPKSENISGSDQPDTLKRRIMLGVKYLERTMDCELGCIPYFKHQFADGHTRLSHEGWDWCDISSRYAVALIKVADVHGIKVDDARLRNLEKTILENILKDGLAYRRDSDFSDVEADIFDQGSVLLYLVEKYRRTKNEEFCSLIERVIQSLLAKAEKTEHGFRFAYPVLLPDGTRGIGKENWQQADPCHHAGRLLYPLAKYLSIKPDSKNARNLAKGIAEYIVKDSKVFSADGSFAGHSHSRTNTLLGLLILAKETKDFETVKQIWTSVDWIIGSTPQWGWIPEFMPEKNQNEHRIENLRAETDALVDMISILFILAREEPRYWTVATRYIQNGLMVAQLTDDFPGGWKKPKHSPVGSFCGYCNLSSFGMATMNCCSPAGTELLAKIYEKAVVKDGSFVRVNLLMDRDGPLVSIKTSTNEQSSRTEIRIKKAGNLVVRIPKQSNLKIIPKPQSIVDESLAFFPERSAGETIKIEYDTTKRTETFTLANTLYKFYWLSDKVVGVEPEGKYLPFFEK